MNMIHRPHEHYPLLAFGLAAAPLSAVGLLRTGCVVGVELAAVMAIFGACALVLGIIEYWRYN